MSEELKPCPFCGGTPNLTHGDYVEDDMRPMTVVECRSCSAWVRVEHWNMRTKPAEQQDGPGAIVHRVECEDGSVEFIENPTVGFEKCRLEPLYSRPAAQAVKLPERRNERPLGNWTTAEYYHEAKGFNDALDAVAQLNQSPNQKEITE